MRSLGDTPSLYESNVGGAACLREKKQRACSTYYSNSGARQACFPITESEQYRKLYDFQNMKETVHTNTVIGNGRTYSILPYTLLELTANNKK